MTSVSTLPAVALTVRSILLLLVWWVLTLGDSSGLGFGVVVAVLVALLYGQLGVLSIAGVGRLLGEARTAAGQTLPLVLMLFGLTLKTALFPMHGWLPPAHGIARSPVSAPLSALEAKASF